MIDIKQMISVSLKKANDLKATSNLPPNDLAYLEGKLDLGQDVLKWVLINEKENTTMITNELVSKKVKLSEIVPKKRESKLETLIVQIANDLKSDENDGDAVLIDKDKIKWGHFSAKVSQMRGHNLLGPDITAKQSGENFYLVKLPKGQTVQPRRKRETANA